MIPLNKPVIFASADLQVDGSMIFSKYFPYSNLTLTFSARQGLNIIYRKLFKERGKLVVAVSPLTCFEAIMPIIVNGHMVSFVDVDAWTFNMDESLIPPEADVIQAIHLGGNPQNMDKITSIVERTNKILIEDCAQGFMSFYNNKPLGSFGDYSVFSLPKNIYSIAGGLLLSKDDIEINTGKEMGFFSTNYRLIKRKLESHLSAGISIANLFHRVLLLLKSEKLKELNNHLKLNNKALQTINLQSAHINEMLELRAKNAQFLLNGFTNSSLVPQKSLPNVNNNYNRVYFRSLNKSAVEIIAQLRKKGVGANHLAQSAYKYYQDDIFANVTFKDCAKRGDLPNYESLHNKIFCIPVSPALSIAELNHIILHLNKI